MFPGLVFDLSNLGHDFVSCLYSVKVTRPTELYSQVQFSGFKSSNVSIVRKKDFRCFSQSALNLTPVLSNVDLVTTHPNVAGVSNLWASFTLKCTYMSVCCRSVSERERERENLPFPLFVPTETPVQSRPCSSFSIWTWDPSTWMSRRWPPCTRRRTRPFYDLCNARSAPHWDSKILFSCFVSHALHTRSCSREDETPQTQELTLPSRNRRFEFLIVCVCVSVLCVREK